MYILCLQILIFLFRSASAYPISPRIIPVCLSDDCQRSAAQLLTALSIRSLGCFQFVCEQVKELFYEHGMSLLFIHKYSKLNFKDNCFKFHGNNPCEIIIILSCEENWMNILEA